MPLSKAEYWDDSEAAKARDLMECFCSPAEVAATMGCEESDLNRLCLRAFGRTLATMRGRCADSGRAKLRKKLFAEAMDGNMKALDMLAREQLEMDPVARRTAKKAETTERKPEPKQAMAPVSSHAVSFKRSAHARFKAVGE